MNAKVTLDRMRKLVADGVLPTQNLDDALANTISAAAKVVSLRADL